MKCIAFFTLWLQKYHEGHLISCIPHQCYLWLNSFEYLNHFSSGGRIAAKDLKRCHEHSIIFSEHRCMLLDQVINIGNTLRCLCSMVAFLQWNKTRFCCKIQCDNNGVLKICNFFCFQKCKVMRPRVWNIHFWQAWRNSKYSPGFHVLQWIDKWYLPFGLTSS